MKTPDAAVYEQLFKLAHDVANQMGKGLQGLSWTWKNKPESQSADDKRAA